MFTASLRACPCVVNVVLLSWFVDTNCGVIVGLAFPFQLAEMPPRKKHKSLFQSLQFEGGVTDAGLIRIAKKLAEAKVIDETIGRYTIQNDELWHAVGHQERLSLEDGGEFVWHFLDPNLFLSRLVHNCPAFASAIRAAWLREPSSTARPWRICVAWDEYTPGNSLQVDNTRKVLVISFFFLELGAMAFSNEALWLTPAVIRHKVGMTVSGAYSQCITTYLRKQLMGPCGIFTVGVALNLGLDQPANLRGEVTHVLGDGEGLEQLYQWRGASSIKPCLRHWNVVPCGSQIVEHDATGTFCELSCCEAGRFLAYTDEEMLDVCKEIVEARNRYAAGTMGKTPFLKLLKASGFNCCKHGFLFSVAEGSLRGVRPSQAITVDWMHTFLQDGVLTTELLLLVNAAKLDNNSLIEFLRDEAWQWPGGKVAKSKGRLLWKVFDPKRSSKERIRAGCSEMLGVYGMIRHFVENRLPPAASEARGRAEKSFYACCALVDQIQDGKLRGRAAERAFHDELEELAKAWMVAHREAYGDHALKPKSHWVFDVVMQIRRDRQILDCFVVERMHLRIKRIAETVNRLPDFEKTIISRYACLHEKMLKEKGACSEMALVGATFALEEFPGIRFADACRWQACIFEAGDRVMWEDGAGSVVACGEDADGRIFALVEQYDFVARRSRHSAVWRRCDPRLVLPIPASDSARHPALRPCRLRLYSFNSVVLLLHGRSVDDAPSKGPARMERRRCSQHPDRHLKCCSVWPL